MWSEVSGNRARVCPRGAVASRVGLMRWILPGMLMFLTCAAAAQEPPGEQIARQSDCFSCHEISAPVVGPAFTTIAQRYHDTPAMVQMLAHKIIRGSTGEWGNEPMPPHPDVSAADAQAMVGWLLTLKGSPTRDVHHYSYRTPAGKQVELPFAVFTSDTHDKVTDDIAGGYDKFDTYCARCHGLNATGTGDTPNLQAALQNGMTESDFMAITMEGRSAKGMPKWAGTLTADEMNQIYEYIKSRAAGLLAAGPPPSD